NKEEGLTVLLVEQKLHFARATADRFAILDRGSKVAEGGMGELDDRLIKEFLTV
ncbi:MAG: ABC transporter ATP-binding protein, partial [Alcanivorax sediminis]